MTKLKYIFISVFFLLLSIPFIGNGQSLSVRTGLSISNVSFKIKGTDGYSFADNAIGLPFTLNYNYSTSNQYRLNFELQYFRKGYYYRIQNYNHSQEEKANFKIDYLQSNFIYEWCPLLKKNQKNELYFFTGGYFAYKIAARWKYLEEVTKNKYLAAEYKSIDFGVILGIGIQNLSFFSKKFKIDIRYYLGMQNIIKHPFYQMYNRSFELGVQYKLF